MKTRLGCAMIMGGLVLGLSGCGGGSGGGLTRTATPVVKQPTNNPTNSAQNPFTNNNNTNQATDSTATAFIANVNDSKALNITRVMRPSSELTQEIQALITLTNAFRAEKGLPALTYDERLSAFAQMRASELEILPTGVKRINGEEIGAGGINLGENTYAHATGNTASNVIAYWKNDAKSSASLLDANFEKIGVGVVHIPNSEYGYYWVQILDGRRYNGNRTIPYEFVNSDVNTSPLTQLVINNRTIPISLTDKGQWQAINTNGSEGWVNGYDHARFGVIKPQGSNATQLFYQGNQTVDYAIPKTGLANYQGTASLVKDGKITTNAPSEFTANFDTRKLDGKITNNGTTIDLTADINGSAFASRKEANVQMQGAFFGDNAKELAGVFNDNTTSTKGVFGAKQ